MSFLEIVQKLQQENKGYLVLVKSGIFFITIGKDAIFLSDICGLKLICASKERCKCGIPVKSIEKYMLELSNKNYSFVIYDYAKTGFQGETNKYKLIFRFTGGNSIGEKYTKNNIGCRTCTYQNKYEEKSLEVLMKQMEGKLNKEGENVNINE